MDWTESSSFDWWNWKMFYNFKPKENNWDELKKQGRVEEISKEEDGFVTITRTFVSADGKTKITEVDSIPTFSSQALRLMDIENELKYALEDENYEKAIKLRDEKKQIENTIKKRITQ